MRQLLSLALVLSVASVAMAGGGIGETSYNWSIPAGGIAIPDALPAGISVDVVVNDNIDMAGAADNCVEVTLTFGGPAGRHTWIGDLSASLTKVGDGTSFLFNRIGRTSGSTGFGDTSDAIGPYTFTNKAPAGDIWAAAAAETTGTQPVPAGAYRATNTSAVTNSAPPLDLCAPFLAGGSIGTWRLTVADLAGGDTGNLMSASLTLKPEPSTLALLGLGALGLIRRRRVA